MKLRVSTKIVQVPEWDEYKVYSTLYKNGKKAKRIKYFTDDLEDAKITAKAIAKELLDKEEI